MDEKTYFIAFEGIDGCGKDTQLQKLIPILKEDDGVPFGDKFSNIWLTREPTRFTEAGREILQAIRERDVSAQEAATLFVGDRIEHSQIIRDVLKHSHVLTSRYDLSTLAYQMTQGMSFDELYDMHKYGDEGCLIPDLTIVFDLPVDTALERMSGRDSQVEIYENKEFMDKLYEKLDFCINELRERDGRKILVVDASKSVEEVTEEMVKGISEILNE